MVSEKTSIETITVIDFVFFVLLQLYLADILDAWDCLGEAGELENKCPQHQHLSGILVCFLWPQIMNWDVAGVLWVNKDLPAHKYWGPVNWYVSFSEPLNPLQTAVQTLGPFPRAELLTIEDLAHMYYY